MDINKIQFERKNNKFLRSMRGKSHPGDLHNSYREGEKREKGRGSICCFAYQMAIINADQAEA